ncbi:potassium-transporting ATPase subunit KdpC [Streptomyces hirsutus]|uniref:potassium-transporting ATPase subunit KdpC n=1 Tax=Streptomyces hirsutus TaxID=35620 RepID=UPI0006E36BBC|nr:potassium-transporting ATPase subunit KdpC [Streptomyces hirsutus]
MTDFLPIRTRILLSALRMLLVFTAITGLIYPLAVTGVAQSLFGGQADGSQIKQNGKAVGSSLIGQEFNLPQPNPDGPNEQPRPDPRWFQPRPSSGGYDPLASGASNLGPHDKRLIGTIHQRRRDIARFNHVDPAAVPPDAVTASGSGLDPHISTAYARLQTARVAKARGMDPAVVRRLVDDHIQGRILGFLGQERVNVVELNHALATLPQGGTS